MPRFLSLRIDPHINLCEGLVNVTNSFQVQYGELINKVVKIMEIPLQSVTLTNWISQQQTVIPPVCLPWLFPFPRETIINLPQPPSTSLTELMNPNACQSCSDQSPLDELTSSRCDHHQYLELPQNDP